MSYPISKKPSTPFDQQPPATTAAQDPSTFTDALAQARSAPRTPKSDGKPRVVVVDVFGSFAAIGGTSYPWLPIHGDLVAKRVETQARKAGVDVGVERLPLVTGTEENPGAAMLRLAKEFDRLRTSGTPLDQLYLNFSSGFPYSVAAKYKPQFDTLLASLQRLVDGGARMFVAGGNSPLEETPPLTYMVKGAITVSVEGADALSTLRNPNTDVLADGGVTLVKVDGGWDVDVETKDGRPDIRFPTGTDQAKLPARFVLPPQSSLATPTALVDTILGKIAPEDNNKIWGSFGL